MQVFAVSIIHPKDQLTKCAQLMDATKSMRQKVIVRNIIINTLEHDKDTILFVGGGDDNMEVGEIVKVKNPLAYKSYNVKISELRPEGFYGYRVKNNGEIFGGRLGKEDYFTNMTIVTETVTKPLRYKTGDFCLQTVMRYNIYNGVGVVVGCTSRSVSVEWIKELEPRRYTLKEFRYGTYTREEVQNKIDGKNNFGDVIINQATPEAKLRFDELGFDTTNLVIKEDPFKDMY